MSKVENLSVPLHPATPCSKLVETANLEVNTFASKTGDFELTGRGKESISCLRNDDAPRAAPLSYTGSKLSEDPPSAAPSGYTGSKLSETGWA